MSNAALSLLVGLVLVIVATNIPFIGGILKVLLTLIGLGAFLIAAWRLFKGKSLAETPQVSAF